MTASTFDRMERLYAPQVALYDLTRRLSLPGRKRLIETVSLQPGLAVLDVGCDTGWMLAELARREPTLHLYGLDASAAMLRRAQKRLSQMKLNKAPLLVRGLAEELDANVMFGRPQGFDLVLLSFCLSMMPRPIPAVDRALAALAPGGTLAIADFGAMASWPVLPARAIQGWLGLFGAAHRPEVGPHLRDAAARTGARLSSESLFGGYTELHLLRSAGAAGPCDDPTARRAHQTDRRSIGQVESPNSR